MEIFPGSKHEIKDIPHYLLLLQLHIERIGCINLVVKSRCKREVRVWGQGLRVGERLNGVVMEIGCAGEG